ncbi:hypothetical protein D3C76_1281370 [compost metagenome]
MRGWTNLAQRIGTTISIPTLHLNKNLIPLNVKKLQIWKSSVVSRLVGLILGAVGRGTQPRTALSPHKLLEAGYPLVYTPDDDKPGLDKGPESDRRQMRTHDGSLAE